MAEKSRQRLEALRKLLARASAHPQEELQGALARQGFKVTQSTISRSLRKLGAQKIVDPTGATVYRLAPDVPKPGSEASLSDLVMSIESNGAIIVIHTTPGSASLIARHLDYRRPAGLLGTVAGDDTIFVAARALADITPTVEAIRQSLY